MEKKVSSKEVVLTSFIVDLSDVVLNIVVAFVSGSVIMLAEALEGAADLLTSGLLYIGLRQSMRRANHRHPFGFGREIYFWTLMASIVMLVLSSTLSIHYGLDRVMHPQTIHRTAISFAVLTLGLVTNGYAFYLSYRRLRQNDSTRQAWRSFLYSGLIETKATFVLDLTGSIAAAFGLVALTVYAMTGDGRFDGLGAILVGLTVAAGAIFLMREIKDLLVGRSALPETEAAIKAAAMTIKGVQSISNLRTMYIGSERLLVTLTVELDARLKAGTLETLIEDVKTQVKKDVPTVHHIHVEIETDLY